MSTKASELCQTLGYHRKPPQNGRQSVSPRYAQFLFWTAYFVDKSLSLRLGRASTIQDWDITTSPPTMPSDDEEPVLAFYVLWTKTARCQGSIYEMLYSPASVTQPDGERQSRVNSLAANLHQIARETEKTRVGHDFTHIAFWNDKRLTYLRLNGSSLQRKSRATICWISTLFPTRFCGFHYSPTCSEQPQTICVPLLHSVLIVSKQREPPWTDITTVWQ